MFNILDFIDSKDIRDYNKRTKFTPIEQAHLICYSRKTTIEEKLAAWHELLDTFSEEEFKLTHFGKIELDDSNGKSNKQILVDTVAICEKALALRSHSDGVVFETVYYKHDDVEYAQRVYFDDYYEAVDYLKQEHQRQQNEWTEWYQKYLDEKDLPHGSAIAKIAARPYGKNDWFNTTFYFDDDIRLTTIDPTYDLVGQGWCNAAYCFTYVPLPFRKGDIVRVTRLIDTKYGVIAETPDEACYRDWMRKPGLEELHITLNLYEPDEGELGRFDCYGYNPLEFEICPDDDLPDDQRNLTLLREVYLGELPVGQLIFRYSHFGREAYHQY